MLCTKAFALLFEEGGLCVCLWKNIDPPIRPKKSLAVFTPPPLPPSSSSGIKLKIVNKEKQSCMSTKQRKL